MILEKDRIEYVAAYFRECAEKYVDRGERERSHNKRYNLPTFKNFSSLEEMFSEKTNLENFPEEDIVKVEIALKAIGLSEFNYVASGTTAEVYESSSKIVRIGPYPRKKYPRYYELDFIRPYCPMVIQPSFFYNVEGAGICVEVLPYITMIEDNEIPDTFRRICKVLLEGTQFKLSPVIKDVGVLPDGTPVFVDPDCMTLIKQGKPIEEDFALIAQRTRELALPEPLSWILQDGRFKQEAFYPSPAKNSSIDRPYGFRLSPE